MSAALAGINLGGSKAVNTFPRSSIYSRAWDIHQWGGHAQHEATELPGGDPELPGQQATGSLAPLKKGQMKEDPGNKSVCSQSPPSGP